MPLIFSYGTLQEPKVQLATFGRRLNGQSDELPGYERALVRIEDPEVAAAMGRTHYDNVEYKGNPHSRVAGTVFEITDAELAATDDYERDAAYERFSVILASGKQAWVYANRPSATRPTELRTTRLILRKPKREDAPAMFATYAQDPAVTRFLMWRPHADIAESYAAVERFIAGWESQTDFFWFIFDQQTGSLIGSIAARRESDCYNVGFLLAQQSWGRSYMPEAIAAVTDWAFHDAAILRIWAWCDVENSASARALEKAGFVREGVLPAFSVLPNLSESPRDCYAYRKDRSNH